MKAEIMGEVARALKRLGSKEAPRNRREAYDALSRAGADRFLLATVGSWGDTISDAEVLDALRTLNAGKPLLDEVYASTSKRR
jgi:hypothetical protein